MRAVLERVAVDDYRASGESVESSGREFSAAKVGALVRREGEALERELFGPEAALRAAQAAPRNPPEWLILSGDGSRYRSNEADQRKAADGRPARPPATAAQQGLKPEERDRGWRENKLGVIIRPADRGRELPDGSYRPPREQVKTYVATTGDIQEFGRDMHTESDRRGGGSCPELVWVADHGHGLPEMQAREFPQAHVITDFFHVAERLADCARIIVGEGETAQKARRKYWRRLRGKLWDGQVQQVIKLLTEKAEELAPRPKAAADLPPESAAHQLWTHVFYLEKHHQTKDYPAYRARGWPMGSGTMESTCGRFGNRVKHNRMRWTRRNANALHHIKAAIYSEDQRWDKRWPPPIPVLELPLAG